LSLSEQDIKEFETSIFWKVTIEGAIGDLLKTKRVSWYALEQFNDKVSIGRTRLNLSTKRKGPIGPFLIKEDKPEIK
jgi:hypothetical protein